MNREEAIRLANSAFLDVEQGKYLKARIKLEKALELADDIPDIHNEYATVLSTFGEAEQARGHILRAIQLSPKEPKFWACLSKWYFDRQDFPEALKAILVVEQIDPYYPTLAVAKMHIAQAMGAAPAIIETYREKARVLYESRGQRADGMPLRNGDIDKILSLEEDPIALENKRLNTNDYAWSIMFLNHPSDPEANKLYKKAMAAEGGMGKVIIWMLFYKGHIGSGLYDRALGLYEKSLEKEPTCPKVHTGFGILLARIGRKQEALQHFLRANDLHPNNAWIEANLSLCYYELSDFESAARFHGLAEAHIKPEN